MLNKRQEKELRGAGDDYVADWLAWHRFDEKDTEGKLKVLEEFDGQSEAYDIAAGRMDGQSRLSVECAADLVYEGMRKRIKEMLVPKKSK